jgi:hypothetical protein
MEVIPLEVKHHLPILGFDDCGCCQTNDSESDESGKGYGCHEKNTVLTHREEKVLKRLRQLGLQARVVKNRIKDFEKEESLDLQEKRRAMEELESLRQLRLELELERIAAAEERMRLLGHA